MPRDLFAEIDDAQTPVDLLADTVTEKKATALDYLKGVAAGSNKLVSGIGYLAEKVGAEDVGAALRMQGDSGSKYWTEKMTEGGKAASASQVFEDDPDSITGIRLGDKWGQALLMGAAQSAPSMLAAAIPGGIATSAIQGLARLGLAGGAGATIPLLAGTAAPIGVASNVIARVPSAIGFGAAEGVTAGAMNAADLKTSIEGMPFESLAKSPVFVKLSEKHGPEMARQMIAEQAASDVFGKTALSTGAIGAVTGGGALAQAYQKATAGAKGGIISQFAKGAGQEAFQETPQSGFETRIQNIAERDYLDPSINPMRGVVSSALSGGAVGGLTGGIFGAGGVMMQQKQAKSDAALKNITNPNTSTDEAIADFNTALDVPVPNIMPRDVAQGGLDISAISQRNQEAMFRESLAEQGQLRQSDINELEALINDETADINMRRDALLSLQSQKREALDGAFRQDTLGLPSPNDPTDILRVSPAGEVMPETRQQRIEAERAKLRAMYRPSGNIDERGVNAQQSTEPVPVQQRQQQIEEQDSGRLQMQAMQDGIAPGPAAIEQGSAQAQAQAASDVQITNMRAATTGERVFSEKAQPVLDLNKQQTGWKRIEGRNNDSITLVSFDGKHAVDFKSSDTKSGSASVRMNAEAHAFAIDNPYTGAPAPQGELISTPIYKKPAPLPTETSAPTPETASPAAQPVAPAPILLSSGKPFASKKVAEFALTKGKHKALKDTHRITKFQDGFAITPKPARTAKQIANDAKMAAKAKARKSVNTDLDSISTAIRKKGGINKNDDLAGEIRDLAFKSNFSGPVWRNDGHGVGIDEMARELHIDGYLQNDDVQELLDKLREDHFGKPQFSSHRGDAPMEAAYQAHAEAQQEAHDAAQAGINELSEEEQQGVAEALDAFAAEEDDLDSIPFTDAEFAALGNGNLDEFFGGMDDVRENEGSAGESVTPGAQGRGENDTATPQAQAGEVEGFALEGETEAAISQREQATEQAQRDEAAALVAEQRAAQKAAEEQRQQDNAKNGNAADAFSLTGTEPVDKRKQNALDKSKAKTELMGQTDIFGQQSAIESIKQSDDIPTADKIRLAAELRKGGVTADDVAAIVGDVSTNPEKTNTSEEPVKKAAESEQVDNQSAPIEDFGQKIEGSRKDMAVAISKELGDDEIATLPLSKIWPADLSDKIEDKFIAALAFAARAEIPSKPRKTYAVSRWVEKVKMLRGMVNMVLSSDAMRSKAEALLNETKSLEGFTAKVALLEVIDRDQWGRIGAVGEYPDSYRYEGVGDDVKKVPTPMVKVVIDNTTQYFKGISSVADAIDQINEKLGVEARAKKMVFEVRGTDSKGYGINKKGDSEYRRLKTFKTSKEAFDYRNSNYDDLVAAWEDIKNRDNVKKDDVRGETNRPRTADDYRKGKDISTEQFQNTFGFRGGQFGKWVSQGSNAKERQWMLNSAYDALMDLSNILNIPPKAISLNGELGMAFGARGSGAASAHYESDTLVINLTKTRGAGTLAHEWFHALDNYFQRGRGALMDNKRESRYITYAPEAYYEKADGTKMPVKDFEEATNHDPVNNFQSSPDKTIRRIYLNQRRIENKAWWKKYDAVRPEVEAKFAELVQALNDSPMTARASIIDKGKSDGYWSRIIERAARSFENYVIAKMAEKGYHNDYLANVVNIAEFKRDAGRYPYLKDEELSPVVEAFDNLFGELKTKETDKGTALYSRRATPAIGITRQSLTDTFTRKFPQLSKALDKMLQRGEAGKKGGVVLASSDNIAQVFADKTGRSLEDAKAALQMSHEFSDGGTVGKWFWSTIGKKETYTTKEIEDALSLGRRGGVRNVEWTSSDDTGKAERKEASKTTVLWENGKTGIGEYVTIGTETKDGRFIVSVIPYAIAKGQKLDSFKKLGDLSAVSYAFQKTGNGEYELSIADPLIGGTAFNHMAKHGLLESAGSAGDDGTPYFRVNFENRYETSSALLQEAIRRLALNIGETPNVIVSGRDTGARSGSREQREFTKAKIEARFSVNGDIQAFFDPKSGLTFMVEDNLDTDTAANVLLHEATHGNQNKAVDTAAVTLLTKTRKITGGKTRAYLDEAANRMVESGAAQWEGNNLTITDTQEAAPYIVEVIADKARESGFSAVDGKFMDWVDSQSKALGKFIRDFVASVRASLLRYGVPLKMTVDDLVAYAQASMKRMADGDVKTADRDVVSGSNKEQSRLLQAWKMLAENDELFQHPVSESKDMEQIFDEVAPDVLIEHSGGDADLADAWMVYPRDNSGNAIRSTPGFVLLYKDGSVELNVYQFGEGNKGSQVYSAVGNYAYNNGLKFKGDRLGMTETGMFRRLENMISLALKFGTTDFMQPHPEQLSKMGIDWKEGKTDHNLEEMLKASYQDTAAKFPKIKDIYYDFNNGRFQDSSGNEVVIIDPRSEDTGKRFSSASRHRPNLVEEARSGGLRAGETTLKRVAFSNTFLREETGPAAWGSISAFLHSWSSGEVVKDFVGLAYSRKQSVDSLNSAIEKQDGIKDAFRVIDFDDGGLNAALQTISRRLNIVYVLPSNPDAAGIHGIQHGNTIYINPYNGEHGFIQLAGHELLHYIRKTAPDAYSFLESAARTQGMDSEAYQRRLAENGIIESLDSSEEELLGDFTGDALADPKFLKLLAKDNPTSFKKLLNVVVNWLKSVAGKLTNKGFGSEKYVNDVESLRGYLWAVLDAYSKADDVAAIDGVERVKFSRSTTTQQSDSTWDAPAPSMLDNFVYRIQNKLIDLKEVQKAIKEKSGEIRDEINAYLKEELYHGRAAIRIEEFLNNELNPLITLMRMNKVTQAELGEYLWAKHAKEANAHIASINPNNEEMWDGGSGMTDQEADDYMAALTPEKRKTYELLAKRVYAMTAATRKQMLDYGLISKEEKAAWENAYQFYVPLNREDMDTMTHGTGTGQGYSIRGKESKRRTGSKREVVNIIGNIANQRDKAVVRGEKNRVVTALYGLVKESPNPDFWKADKPPTMRVVETIGGVDQVVERIDPLHKSKDNVVMVKIPNAETGKIEEHSIIFNERNERAMRMAASIKNLDGSQLGELLGTTAKITRYFSAINTQYNPIFGIVNITRDVQGAMLNLTDTPLAGKQVKILADVGRILAGSFKHGMRDFDGEWKKLSVEFAEAGGKTGYKDMFRTGTDRTEAIQHALDPDWWTKTKWGKAITANGYLESPATLAMDKGVRPVLDWLSDYNDNLENTVRLAAYKEAKAIGMSKEQAASLAKNLTVNFNRKGEIAMQAGALYAFFNASVQGMTRMVFALKGPAGKRIIYGGMLLGAMQAMMLAAAGFDDDEPPQFVRERNLILPIGNNKYLTLPMPLGFNVLPNIGRLSMELMLSGGKGATQKIENLLGVLVDATNPLGGSSPLAQVISPTVTDPLVALGMNKDWTGKPIAREDFNSLNPTPGFTRSKDVSSGVAKWMSEAINTLTGGTKYTKGIASPTADQIEYLVGQVTGGVGRELGKAVTTSESVFTGEELPEYKIPLVGRFYGATDGQASQGNAFYSNIKKMNDHEATIKGLRKDGKQDEAAEYIRNNPESRMVAFTNMIEHRVSELRKQKRHLIENDASKERIKLIEMRITAEMKRLNDRIKRSEEREEQAA